MRFSQRIGQRPICFDLQVEGMDSALRNSIWNVFHVYIFGGMESDWISNSKYEVFFKILWINFFKLPIDELNDYYASTHKELKNWFFSAEWFEIYDLVEVICSLDDMPYENDELSTSINTILEREMAGYRLINHQITPITDEAEINEIRAAIQSSSKGPLVGVREHLQSALGKLSDRKNPDFRNSIKESISAVEGLTSLIAGNSRAELGKALKMLADRVEIHPALKNGFLSIYGYTSDENGIRHAMMELPSIDFSDAKYMLVSCSAFINYLVDKAQKADIKIDREPPRGLRLKG